ncbi:MAG: hypothetical protein SOZ04_04450 [Bacilli bacterium]|nr:hypothetical protein [Bacilli bacterium]
MNKNLKKCILAVGILTTTCACSLPFQSSKYPAWSTNGIIDYEEVNGKKTNGWQGLTMNDTAHTALFDIEVLDAKEVLEYASVKPSENSKLILAKIVVTNISQEKQYLSKEDFPLMWNLQNNEASYVYSKKPVTSEMLKDNLIVPVNETITFNTLYEIDKNISKPYAIFYGEKDSKNNEGNSFYIYLK